MNISDGFVAAVMKWSAKKWIDSPGELASVPFTLPLVRVQYVCCVNTELIWMYHVGSDVRTAHIVVAHDGGILISPSKVPKTASMDLREGPRPLSCLSAMAVVEYQIPYSSVEISPRVKAFISLHDPRGP